MTLSACSCTQYGGDPSLCPVHRALALGHARSSSQRSPSAIADTVRARTTKYGDFRDQGATAQRLKITAREGASWEELALYQREAIDMILHKVARIVNGDPNYADSWHDIQGYAKITEDRLPGGPEAEATHPPLGAGYDPDRLVEVPTDRPDTNKFVRAGDLEAATAPTRKDTCAREEGCGIIPPAGSPR